MKKFILFMMVLLLISSTAYAADNPKASYADVTAKDVAVDAIDNADITISDTSKLKFEKGEYTHDIGRLTISMKPNIKNLNNGQSKQLPDYADTDGNKISWATSDGIVEYEIYESLLKEQVTLYQPSLITYKYDIDLIDWTTEEYDEDGNFIGYHTEYAKDSTTDINLDQFGNLIITVNGAETVVIPKPFAYDANGKYYDLDFDLDKSSKKITIVGDLSGAVYPLVVDPTERITNGGFETGDYSGWAKYGGGGIKYAEDYGGFGTYVYEIKAYSGSSYASISQDHIDLTDIDALAYYYFAPDADTNYYIKLDNNVVHDEDINDAMTEFTLNYIDVTSYIDDCYLKFCVSGDASINKHIYIDDVTTTFVPPDPIEIETYSPSSNPTIECDENQIFTVTTNENGDIKWYVDNSLVETDSSTNSASYTPSPSLASGTYEVKAIADGQIGTDTQIWTLTVNYPSVTSYNPTLDTTCLYSETIDFTIETNGECDFDWYFDDVLQETDSATASASYTSPSNLVLGGYEIKVIVDNGEEEFTHTWNLEIIPNFEYYGAFDSINNLRSNTSSLTIDLDEYYMITTMTSWDENKTSYENIITMVGAPITYGGSDEFAGSWFYAFLFIVPLIFVYGKSKSIEVTSMVMLMMSSTIIVSSMTDLTNLPASFMTLMYTTAILGIVGVLYSLIGDD